MICFLLTSEAMWKTELILTEVFKKPLLRKLLINTPWLTSYNLLKQPFKF